MTLPALRGNKGGTPRSEREVVVTPACSEEKPVGDPACSEREVMVTPPALKGKKGGTPPL